MKKLIVALFFTAVSMFAQTSLNVTVDIGWVPGVGNPAGTLTVIERAPGNCTNPGAFVAITPLTGVAGNTFSSTGPLQAGQTYCLRSYHVDTFGQKSITSNGANAAVPNILNPPTGMSVVTIKVNL